MVPSASAALLGVLVGLFSNASLLAQHAPETERAVRDKPLSLQPPDVITRDAQGRASVRAVRVATPLRIDGRLDEPLYTSVPSMSDFTQIEPIARTIARVTDVDVNAAITGEQSLFRGFKTRE